jgi:tetratricopeptide (TPR) repeat protein
VQRRTALHCIVGTAIEELYRDRLAEHYDALAHHFTRGEDWERALRYHELAADKAAHAYANQAAVEHYRQALEIAERLDAPGEQRMDLEQRLGAVLHVISAFRHAGEAYLRAAELAGDGERGARNLARAADSLLWAHDYERGRLAWSRSLQLAHTHGARAVEAMALAMHSEQSAVEGDFDDAWQERYQRAAEIAEETGDPEAILLVCGNAGLALKHCGESRRAIPILERTLANAEEHGLEPSFAMWVLGLSLGAIGQYGRTLAIFGQAVDQCERAGDMAVQARLQNSLGWCLAEIGCHARASEHNRRSSELAAEMVKRDLVPNALELYANAEINLAGNLLAGGDHQGALLHLEPIQEQLAQPGDPARKVEARALELRGRALVVMDEREAAASSLREALRIAREIEYPPVQWRAFSLFAELERRSGDRSRSRDLLHEARSLIDGLASSLPELELQRGFRALGERLEEDPLGAHR